MIDNIRFSFFYKLEKSQKKSLKNLNLVFFNIFIDTYNLLALFLF